MNEFNLPLKQNKCECKICQFIRRYTEIANSLQNPNDKEFMMNHLDNFINLEEELGMLQEYVKDLEGKKMNELQECHRLVWAFRKEIEPYWATPDPLNSLRYAFTECAEAMDAWLRAERPSDSRNNDRQSDVLDELADCAIMLLTAVNFDEIKNQSNGRYDTDFIFLHAGKPEQHRLEVLAYQIANALVDARDDSDEVSSIYLGWIHDTVMSLGWIASYPQMELKQRIQGRLAKIATKHAPNGIDFEIIEKLDLWEHNKPEKWKGN